MTSDRRLLNRPQKRLRALSFLTRLGLVGAAAMATALPVTGAEPGQILRWTELPAGAEPPAALPRWQRLLLPQGQWCTLTVEGAPTPASSGLPVPAGRIRWAAVIPEPAQKEFPGAWQIVGDLSVEPPSVEELTPLKQPPALLPVPPRINLARHQNWTPFGVEERATLKDDDTGSAFLVKAGEKPAGFYTATPWRLPQGPPTTWRLEATLTGRGKIMLGIAAETQQGFGDATPVSTLELTGQPQVVSYTMPGKMAVARSLRLSLVTLAGGEIEGEVDQVRWLPEAPAAKVTAPEKGVWDWSTRPDNWNTLLPAWKAAGITVLQLALPRELGGDEGPVAIALASLRMDGFKVVAVEGDPHMILPQARASVMERHKALGRWQGRFLDGIQYDVEPYLLPGFRLQAARWHQYWLDLYRDLARPAEGSPPCPVEPVVPFWLIAQKEAAPLLEGLARSASRLVIMNYRSDPVEAAAWATAWLEWSRKQECPVALAVECGPVGDLKSATFHKAAEGTLWMAPWAGHGTVAVLYENPVAAGSSGRVFSLSREGAVPGSRTTLRDRPVEEVSQWLDTVGGVAGDLAMPPALQPRLLLHEPTRTVLEHLATKIQAR